MVRHLLTIIMIIVLFVGVPCGTHAAVELDVDGNGAIDIDKGGTNSLDGSVVPTKESGLAGLIKLYTADALVEFGSGLIGPDTASDNTLFKLPSTDGTVGQQWAFSAPVTEVIDSVSYEIVTISWVDNGSGGSGVIATVPTFRDAPPCTRGEYSYSVDGLTKYDCVATDTWFTSTLVDNLSPTPIIPTFTSATVDGVDLQVIFSTPVTQGAGWLETLFTVDATVTGPGIGMTFVNTNGTDTWDFTLDTAMVETDVVTLDYPTTANGVESSTGDDLAALVAQAVTNNTAAGSFVIETFDPVGTDLVWAAVSGSTEIDYDYTTSPAPLSGTQSAEATGAVKSKTVFTAVDSVYVGFILNFDVLPSVDFNFMGVTNGDAINLNTLKLRTSGLLRITTGGVEVNGPTLSPATTYYIKQKYTKGTGADSSGSLWVSTDGTTWGTEYTDIAGNDTAQADTVQLYNDVTSGTTVVFDDVKWSESDFDY